MGVFNVFSLVVYRGYFSLILDQICTEFVRNQRKIENIYRNKKTSCERHVCRIRWFPDKQSFNLLSENQIEELTLSMFLRFCRKIVFYYVTVDCQRKIKYCPLREPVKYYLADFFRSGGLPPDSAKLFWAKWFSVDY